MPLCKLTFCWRCHKVYLCVATVNDFDLISISISILILISISILIHVSNPSLPAAWLTQPVYWASSHTQPSASHWCSCIYFSSHTHKKTQLTYKFLYWHPFCEKKVRSLYIIPYKMINYLLSEVKLVNYLKRYSEMSERSTTDVYVLGWEFQIAIYFVRKRYENKNSN